MYKTPNSRRPTDRNGKALGLSRREALKCGLAALGFSALPGGVMFAAPSGWKASKKPNLVFGVLSDTHLMTGWDGVSPHRGYPHKYIISAFSYFKQRAVDAIVHLGDAAHRGQTREIEFHVEALKKVFGEGRLPKLLLVAGNHEWFGDCERVRKIWPEQKDWKEHALCADFPALWKRAWGEPYKEVWHQEVKGYHFFGRHWDVDEKRLSDLVNDNAAACRLSGKKPFFILSHKRNHFACNSALKAFPNAVAFFGHWHQSNADWKTVFFDSFGGFFPNIQCGACRMDGGNALDASESFLKARPAEDKQGAHQNKVPSRQGMVVSVYDDMVVFERHEFGEGGKLGPDWVLPVEGERGKGKKHPFSREELTKKIGAPQFPPRAKIEVAKTKDGTVNVIIPLANANAGSRPFAYDVAVVGDDPKARLFKSVYWEGCNLGVGHEPDGGRTTLTIPASELPAGKVLTFAVRPLSSLGTKGKAISAKFRA